MPDDKPSLGFRTLCRWPVRGLGLCQLNPVSLFVNLAVSARVQLCTYQDFPNLRIVYMLVAGRFLYRRWLRPVLLSPPVRSSESI